VLGQGLDGRLVDVVLKADSLAGNLGVKDVNACHKRRLTNLACQRSTARCGNLARPCRPGTRRYSCHRGAACR